MIIDAFTFFNELDLLELRLEYLYDIVDYFVIVESNVTHSGKPKSLMFLENKERYKKYLDKIVYNPYIFYNTGKINFNVELSTGDYKSVHWYLENNQRNHIRKSLEHFQDTDYIIVGDIDEIPDKNAIKIAQQSYSPENVALTFEQQLYYYNFYNKMQDPWTGSVFSTVKVAKELSPQHLRSNRTVFPKIQNGGWHFSYFGGTDSIIKKIESFAHQEYNKPQHKQKERIENSIKEGKDLYSQDTRFIKVDMDLLPSDLSSIAKQIFKIRKMSIVVPTMWKYDGFVGFLKRLVDYHSVGEIILINNQNQLTPSDDILKHKKIKIFDFGKNIFVNPAWNLGVEQSQYDDICIMNDDIEFDLNLIDRAIDFLTPETLLGLCPGVTKFNQPPVTDKSIKFEKYVNQHMFGFGCLMFVQKKNWIPIPAGLEIYYGDNWLIETMRSRFDRVFLITDLDFFTPYASTTKTLENKDHILNKENEIYNKEIQLFNITPQEAKSSLENEYNVYCQVVTDIYQHLPLMRTLANECEDIIEMGVRTGVSSRAFLSSDAKKITSYDIDVNADVDKLFMLARKAGKDASYIKADVLNLKIDPVDLLFIDTDHTYVQLSQELALHGNKAKKYIVFHDTHTFGINYKINDLGLLPAILEFLVRNKHWTVHYHTVNNNGLTVLKRLQPAVDKHHMGEDKNLVIGAALGYNVDQIKTFVKSFRKFNSTDDVILLVNNDLSLEQKQFFDANNIKAEYFYTEKFLHMWPNNSRYVRLIEILKSTSYKNVLLSDVRDVVFQSDPFDALDNKLNLFLEDSGVNLIDEQINAQWVKQLFGMQVFNDMSNKQIICSGVILGPTEKIVSLLKIMIDHLVDNPLVNKMPVDQALLNYLFYTSKLTSIDCVLNTNGKKVGTVGLSITHALANDSVEIKNNLLYINNLCPAIVHQYDRSAKLTAHYIQ
jgi:beta-1,4-mannosyl-glycoprotein beta-1,4-N-acetylglucosaminyltransferase